MKKDLIKTFTKEIYSKGPKKKYPTKEIIYNHIDEIRSIDLADFSDYKTSNNKGYRYIFVRIDNFSKCFWCLPLKNKNSQTITNEFSKILSTSKRSPVEIKSDGGSEWYNTVFQNFPKSKNIQHYSWFTDKGPSTAERVIRTLRNLLKKPIFLAGNVDWLSELPTTIKQYNNTIHHSIKMTPVQTSKKSNEKEVSSILQERRSRQHPKYKLGQLVKTADIKKVFSKGDSTNYSYILYTITEVIHDTIPTDRIDYLTERYIENLLISTNITLEQNNKFMKELNLIQKKIILLNWN